MAEAWVIAVVVVGVVLLLLISSSVYWLQLYAQYKTDQQRKDRKPNLKKAICCGILSFFFVCDLICAPFIACSLCYKWKLYKKARKITKQVKWWYALAAGRNNMDALMKKLTQVRSAAQVVGGSAPASNSFSSATDRTHYMLHVLSSIGELHGKELTRRSVFVHADKPRVVYVGAGVVLNAQCGMCDKLILVTGTKPPADQSGLLPNTFITSTVQYKADNMCYLPCCKKMLHYRCLEEMIFSASTHGRATHKCRCSYNVDTAAVMSRYVYLMSNTNASMMTNYPFRAKLVN